MSTAEVRGIEKDLIRQLQPPCNSQGKRGYSDPMWQLYVPPPEGREGGSVAAAGRPPAAVIDPGMLAATRELDGFQLRSGAPPLTAAYNDRRLLTLLRALSSRLAAAARAAGGEGLAVSGPELLEAVREAGALLQTLAGTSGELIGNIYVAGGGADGAGAAGRGQLILPSRELWRPDSGSGLVVGGGAGVVWPGGSSAGGASAPPAGGAPRASSSDLAAAFAALTAQRLTFRRDVIRLLLEESYQQPKMQLHAAAGSGGSGDRAARQRGAGLSAAGNMLEVVVKPFMEEYRKSIDLLSPYA